MTTGATLGPLRQRAVAVRDVLTGLALSWGTIPDLEAAQGTVFDAIRLLSEWCALEADDTRFLERLDAAASCLQAATPAARVGDADQLTEAAGELAALRGAALDVLASQRNVPLRAPRTSTLEVGRPFVASGGVVALHSIAVPPAQLMATEDEAEERDEREAAVDDDGEDPDDADDQDAIEVLRGLGVEVPAGLLGARADAGTGSAAGRPSEAPRGREQKTVDALGRAGLEELAGLSALVDVLEDGPWAEVERAHERLGITLDALVALASPLAPGVPAFDLTHRAFAYASEWTVPDPGRAFALLFPLTNVEAHAALDWVHFSFRRSHPRTHVAFVRTLALGTHPGLDAALVEWLDAETDAARASTLLRAVARRGLAPPPSAALLLVHPDEQVATEAARAIVRSPRELAEPALDEVMSESSPPLVAAEAARSLLRLGANRALDFLRSRIDLWHDAGHEAAARTALACVAAAGDRRDEEALLRWTSAMPRTNRALGFFGASAHLGPLVERLQAAQDVEDRGDLREALHRATGLGYALQRLHDAGHDPGAGVSAEELAPVRRPLWGVEVRALDGSVDLWRRGVEAWAPLPGATRRRLRYGAPHGVLDVVLELADERTPQSVRRLLALEVEMATGAPLPFDLDGWVPRQRAALRALVDTLRSVPGSMAPRGTPSVVPRGFASVAPPRER